MHNCAVAVKTPESIENLIQNADGVIHAALADERYDLAAELANRVYRACGKTNGKKFRKQALERRKYVQELALKWKKVEEARAKLEIAPDDPQANLTLGEFLCFAQGDWQQGLAYLAKSSDGELKELARRENSSPPSDANEQVKLGDAWWDLAQSRKGEEKAALTIRAGYWYEQALPKMVGGLAKSRIEKRMKEHVAVAKESLLQNPWKKAVNKWQVLFCSADPRIWNSEVNQGKKRFAVPVSNAPESMKYLRMRNERGGSVIIELSKDQLLKQFVGTTWGWNGSLGNRWKGYHLGIYNKAWPSRKRGRIHVQSKRHFLGWGFGHIQLVDTGQGYTWAGQTIPPTVFEISVTADDLSATEETFLLKAQGSNKALKESAHKVGKTSGRELVQEENVALASNGTTVSGNFINVNPSSDMIDGKTETNLRGIHYAAGKLPAEWIVTFKEGYRLREIRLKLWDGDKRFYRYAIATSGNGRKYVPLVDRSQGEWRGWQVLIFPKPRKVKFVKILGLHNSAGPHFHVIEFEAYCVPSKR